MADITKLPVDCIVNAATNSLLGGGGVDGAIHRAAGAGLMRSCYMQPTCDASVFSRCETGDAVLTSGPFGKNLLAINVIHTVGPIVSRVITRDDNNKLKSCVNKCLEIAKRRQYKSIAFPAISCGIYNCSGSKWLLHAAYINIKECLDSISNEDSIKHVIFAFTDDDIYTAWRNTILRLLYNTTESVEKNSSSSPSAAQSKAREKKQRSAKAIDNDEKRAPQVEMMKDNEQRTAQSEMANDEETQATYSQMGNNDEREATDMSNDIEQSATQSEIMVDNEHHPTTLSEMVNDDEKPANQSEMTDSAEREDSTSASIWMIETHRKASELCINAF